MSTHGLLPGGGVRLPPNVGAPLPFDPKHKAVILYFMFFAEQARSHTESNSRIYALNNYAHIVASKLMKRVYSVECHPNSIKAYYWATKASVGEVGKWDQHAVAEIISSQVKDRQTFDEVTSFLGTVSRVSSHSPNLAHHCFTSADWGFKRSTGTVSRLLSDFSWKSYGKPRAAPLTSCLSPTCWELCDQNIAPPP